MYDSESDSEIGDYRIDIEDENQNLLIERLLRRSLERSIDEAIIRADIVEEIETNSYLTYAYTFCYIICFVTISMVSMFYIIEFFIK